jgi:hypothetical protein
MERVRYPPIDGPKDQPTMNTKVMNEVTSPMVKFMRKVANHLRKKPSTESSERESISMNSASQKLCRLANSYSRPTPPAHGFRLNPTPHCTRGRGHCEKSGVGGERGDTHLAPLHAVPEHRPRLRLPSRDTHALGG